MSPSPSLGYSLYTRANKETLPTTDADLDTLYSAQNELDVEESDNVRVGQSATSGYVIHQFKNFIPGGESSCNLTWEGQSTLAPSASTVFLQIFNRNTPAWETVDSNNTTGVNTDFILDAAISDLTNYKDSGSVISCRVYQEIV